MSAAIPNIDLLTYSEVVEVSGQAGDFHVRIKKKPRYVDVRKCRGCGLCAEACRLSGRVSGDPHRSQCRHRPARRDIRALSAGCPPGLHGRPGGLRLPDARCVREDFQVPGCLSLQAIDLTQTEQFLEVDVGTVVVATGFDVFDPHRKPEMGYGVYPEVITTLEFERLASASGPTPGRSS